MNMLELIGYEYKKMFKRKSFWLNLAAGLLIMLFSGSIMALSLIHI